MKLRVCLWPCIVLACVLVAPSLRAQASPSPDTGQGQAPLSESLHGSAREAYATAKLLVANRDFAGALAKFRQAYEGSFDPRLLYDMAVCEKNLRHYGRMQTLLARYLHDAGPGLAPETRGMVEEALAAIKDLVATVKLTVSEDGATVLLDNEFVGTTPLSSPIVVDLGQHYLAVQKNGFDQEEQPIDATGGREVALHLTLKPQRHLARLSVSADESATISVDGRVVGTGRFEAPIHAGPHTLRVAEPGRVPYAVRVELREGETRMLQVSLEAEHQAAIWPWIVGGTVVAAGAVVGGYFLFRTQEQTTPVPTGILGSVQFSSTPR